MAQLSIEEFAQQVKKKYPVYAKIPDAELTGKILAKYPQYRKQIKPVGREAASKAEIEANKPESTFGSRAREAAIGLLEPFTAQSIYQTGKSAVGALSDILTGEGTKSAQELVSGAIRAPIQPVIDLYEGLTEEDYDKMAHAAGGFASQTVPAVAGIAERAPTIGDLREAATRRGIPERLQARAAENKVPLGRQPWQERALIMGPTSAIGYMAGGPLGAAGAAAGAEGLALIRRSNWYRGGKAALQERIARGLTDPNAVPPSVRTPATPVQSEVPFNAPAGLAESPSTASGQFKAPVTGPRQEIPFNAPGESTGSQPDFKSIEQKIAPAGIRARQGSIAVDAEGNPTAFGKRLVEVVPEIATAAKGARADAALMDGYKRTVQQVNEVEDAIPEGSTVDKIPIVSQLVAMADDYTSRGLRRTAESIQSLANQWLELGDRIPWGEFLARKRAFFQEHNLRSAPMRRAYGVLMEAAGRVSKELQEANSRYSVVRRALDNAQIDVNTGRRIRDVGKTGKSSAMPMSERGEPPTPTKPATGTPPTPGELKQAANPKSNRYQEILATQRAKEGLTAAVKLPDGSIVTGVDHGQAARIAAERYNYPNLRDVLESGDVMSNNDAFGFVTQHGEFISRAEAEQGYGVSNAEELEDDIVPPGSESAKRMIGQTEAAKIGSAIPDPATEASALNDMKFFADDIRQMQGHREKVSGGGSTTMESNAEGKEIEENLSAEWSRVGKSLGLKPPPGLEDMSPGRIAKAIEKGSGKDYERVKQAFMAAAKGEFSAFRESQRESGIGPGELRRRALGLMRQRLNREP